MFGAIRRWFDPTELRKVGTPPDYRFSLANERTFLAWIRTALALAAGGLAAVTILDDFPGEEALGIGLLALSVATAWTSYRRWALTETAIRVDEPLPESKLPLVLAGGVALIVVAAAVLVAIGAAAWYATRPDTDEGAAEAPTEQVVDLDIALVRSAELL